MDKRDLNLLSQGLKTIPLDLPSTRLFAFYLRFLAEQQHPSGRARQRVIQGSWLWPCDAIPEIEATLRDDPSIESSRSLVAFFQAVAVVHHLRDGRKLRKELVALFPGGLPFTLVALAQLLSRSRSLTPRPPASQAKDISDIELWLAGSLLRIAEVVHKELSGSFLKHGIARVCPHCGQLFVEINRSYCSDRCRKAFHDAKLYQKTKTKFRPA